MVNTFLQISSQVVHIRPEQNKAEDLIKGPKDQLRLTRLQCIQLYFLKEHKHNYFHCKLKFVN